LTKKMIEAYDNGDLGGALTLHRQLLPLFTGIFRTQGTILVKAAMKARGLPGGPVRSPLVDATAAELEQLRADCADAGVPL
jgi:4-hydroxy-tetrahydrodipicolinate synthase